ncbi:MAG: type II secretion system F family protein [Rickettsiales bacterium]|nr:type II secretion system F family protein [Rickettsiales bacterium]
MSAEILAALTFVIVFTVYMAVDGFIRKKKQSESLKGRIGPGAGNLEMAGGDESLSTLDIEKSPTAEVMESMLKMVGVDTEATGEFLTKRFAHAGINSPDAPFIYLFMQRIASVFFLLVSIPFFNSGKDGAMFYADIFIGLFLVVVGVFGPYLFLENKIQNRKKTLTRSFPDALDLLLVCVESGLALDASMSRVCAELGRAHPELTGELNRTRLELALLNDRSKALMNLGDRTDLVPFRSLAAALVQTEKFGTSLSDTLRVLSDDYRQTRLLMAENKANRLPALITIPLIFLLMPSFIMIILGPTIVRVMARGSFFGAAR